MVTIDNFFAYSLAGGTADTTDPGGGGGSGGTPQIRLLATNLPAQNQAELQAYYDGQAGDAPDTVPQEVTDEDALTPTGYALYLGHNTWYFRENGTGAWTSFNKGAFSVAIAELYTFK